MNQNQVTIDEIKQAFIKSCITSDFRHFRPYLHSDKFFRDGDKDAFFKFFKYMLKVSKKTSMGDLSLKIEKREEDGNGCKEFCFFDIRHLHPRLTVFVKETPDFISFDILPF